jgi:hypothetical protein
LTEQKAAPKRPRVMGAEAPPGSKNRARKQRHCRNLGDLTTSREDRIRKPEEKKSEACVSSAHARRSRKEHEQRAHTEYRGAKENEAKRDG